MTYGNLKTALADNPESMGHLSAYNTLKYVQWGLVGGGVAMIIGGLARPDLQSGRDLVR